MKREPQNLVGKLSRLFNKQEKLQTAFIMILSVISAGAELIGVSIILPIIDLTLGQGEIEDSFYCKIMVKLFRAEERDSIIIMLIICTIINYIVKNLYFICMYGYVYFICMLEEVIGSHKTIVIDSCESPCGCWELNPRPLEEQSVFLIA